MPPAIHIETSGCAFNVSDSEAMAGTLCRAGYNLVSTPDAADLLILNTCTVKTKTFHTFRRRLESLSGRGDSAKPLIIAGCIPKANPQADYLKSYSLMGPDAAGSVDEVVRETLRGRVVHRLENDSAQSRSSLPVVRRNPVVEILPIARGCRSACTFCQTRLARGRLASFPPEEILNQARRALDEGVKIFWVTAQDVGAYGYDNNHPLPRLLDRLLDLPGDFRVRLGMSSPQWIHERLDEYMRVLEHPRMFKFLHVPIQSGSPRVLDDMKRDGGVTQFETIHTAFSSRFPEGNFVTDLIVGYPTESESEFDETLSLVHRLRLGFVNVSRFSPRPGTAAARLKPLASLILSNRVNRLNDSIKTMALSHLNPLLLFSDRVIVEQQREHQRRRILTGRNAAYRPVLFEGPHLPGEWCDVRISGAVPFHFLGEVIPNSQNDSAVNHI